MVMDQYILDFLAQFEQKVKDDSPVSGVAQPTSKLVKTTDALDQLLVSLALPSLTKEQQTDLRGKRLLDMGDVVYETAAALKEEEDLSKAAETSPQGLEHTAGQDLAVGSLVVQMQNIYNAADLGVLCTVGEAVTLMDQVDGKVGEILQNASLRKEATVIHAIFGTAVEERKKGQARLREAHEALEIDHHDLDEAKAEEDMNAAVRELLADAHAGLSTSPSKSAGKGKKTKV